MTGTVFLLGSGIVQHGWEPIISVLGQQELFTTDVPHEFLAVMGYNSAVVLQEYLQANSQRQNSKAASAYKNLCLLWEIRRELGQAVTNYNNFSIKSQAATQLERLGVQVSSNIVITTNWDTTINTKWNVKCSHLHGDATSTPLIFPTERVCDYRFLSRAKVDDGLTTRLMQASLGRERIASDVPLPNPDKQYPDNLWTLHCHAVDSLIAAKDVVLSGLALNLYDAEIIQVLFDAALAAKAPKRFTLVYPKGSHHEVIRKLSGVFRKPEFVEVNC